MLAQNHDLHRDQDGDHKPPRFQGSCSCSAVVPAHSLDEQGSLIDEVIRFAFDILGAQHLDLRVYEAD